ncbi:hypothetical protein CEXT_172431 [Caerostris extrusa]|uniref:Uncharacterized protein n=1 Tax=Caerostris extrusa TaxID=172846 RepID=A0AAV4RXD9_CAEEX|nr:hypothetical protein CEXT_172431 [Caerostris extrusa]
MTEGRRCVRCNVFFNFFFKKPLAEFQTHNLSHFLTHENPNLNSSQLCCYPRKQHSTVSSLFVKVGNAGYVGKKATNQPVVLTQLRRGSHCFSSLVEPCHPRTGPYR